VGEFKTKITVARPNSSSLRTTIPEGVVKLIDLGAGDELLWKVNIKGGNVQIILSKAKLKGSECTNK
jgi:bifunctional DNA-binding transcriptional regulator/antitoxin component of YhaV-PrlF toxin-antitoxin module